MRAKEFLIDALFSPNLKAEFDADPNYSYLGSGYHAIAYLNKSTGFVTKIIGYSPGSDDVDPQHYAFLVFADFCAKNPENPYLPTFSKPTTFEFEGQKYLKVEVERLFPLEFITSMALWKLTSAIIKAYDKEKNADLKAEISKLINTNNETSHVIGEVLSLIDFDQFSRTVVRLVNIADAYNFDIDLHRENFMHGSDGSIVINDPWISI